MGKNLAGKEIGPGIIQRKNGRYEARYNDRFGKRISISGYELKDVKNAIIRRYMRMKKESTSEKILHLMIGILVG